MKQIIPVAPGHYYTDEGKGQKGLVVFPTIASAIGGAQYARYGLRFAWIKVPMKDKEVRIALSRLPHRDKWTAFNLADMAQKA